MGKKKAQEAGIESKEDVKKKAKAVDNDLDDAKAITKGNEGSTTAPTEAEEKPAVEARGWTPINDITVFQPNWVLKGVVSRRGNKEEYVKENRTVQTMKVILIDEEGTGIGAIMFGDEIDRWEGILSKGLTYYVTNGIMKPSSELYPSANGRIELVFTKQTHVEEANPQIALNNLACTFTNFETLQRNPTTRNLIDITGTVVSIDDVQRVTKQTTGALLIKRDMVLQNDRSVSMPVTLWADLATNEGSQLKLNKNGGDTVVITRARITVYNGNPTINSTYATTVLINPDLKEHNYEVDSVGDGDASTTQEGALNSHWDTAEQVTITDVLYTPKSDLKITSCYFDAQITGIENSTRPWYNACVQCHKSVTITDDVVQCRTCAETKLKKRFALRLTVTDGKKRLGVTLFDAAELILGSTAPEFAESDGLKQSAAMANAIGKHYRFYMNISRQKEKERKEGKITAETVIRKAIKIEEEDD